MSDLYTKPRSVDVIRAVGWVTFTEILRDKILYNVIVAAFLLFALSFVASTLTFLRPERVVLDFGLAALGISSMLIAVLSGAGLLGREFERRTIFVALSRPISRMQYVVGKFAGLAALLGVNWLLLAFVYLAMLLGQTGSFALILNPTLLVAVGLLYLQSLVLASLAIFFSTFSTTSLSVIMSFGLYLLGTNNSEIRLVAVKLDPGVVKSFLNGLATLLPNLEHFNLGLKVTYGLPVGASFAVGSLFYGMILTSLFLLAAGVLVKTREG
ncbi:MAG: ABC transporter permease [Oligoflexia bacterium]|nr:ABC transporter permease [Oligoflexia bacterium]